MEEKDSEKDLERDSIIDQKYEIIRKIGQGEHAKVYLVIDINKKKEYAAKILLENQKQIDIKAFYHEIEILKKITESKGSDRMIIQYIDSGKGEIKKGSSISQNRDYLINNYFSKGNLYTYLKKTKFGFPEKYAKIIFWKILEGIKFLHDLDICHLDIKLDNILLDSHYNPIIMDFGLSSEMIKNDKDEYESLTQHKGSPQFMCPEMFKMVKYHGIQADIFSLGVVLMHLVANKNCFLLANRKDPAYKLFIGKKFDEFWNSFINNDNNTLKIPQDLKDLYSYLIAYLEKNRPKNTSIIFDEPWLAEVKTYKDDDYKEYENYMKSLENEIEEDNEILENNNQSTEKNYIESGFKSASNDYKTYFNSSIKPNYINKAGLNAMNFIKIKGKLNPVDFMNIIANRLKNELKCKIEEYDNKLKFEAVFNNEIYSELEKYESLDNEEEEEEENIMDILQLKDCIIIIKLFESINGGYELHFVKKQGEYMEYYQHFEEIKNIIKDYLKIKKEN